MRHAAHQQPAAALKRQRREEHLRLFVNSFAYRGERCEECGHPWTERGELHHVHCSSFVNPHTIHRHS